MKADDLYARYPEILFQGDLDSVPPGWLGIVDKYLAAVAPLMKGTGYEVVTAREWGGGLDWTWTSMLGAMTPERHGIVDREDALLDLRSYHTCRECGRPGRGWRLEMGRVMTACEEHGAGQSFPESGESFVRTLASGLVRYDLESDTLIGVEHPAGDV